MEATLQDTYSSVLVSNKSSTESATTEVRNTKLVDNDLYGSEAHSHSSSNIIGLHIQQL